MKMSRKRLFAVLIAFTVAAFLFSPVAVSAAETNESELISLFEALPSSDGAYTTSIVSALCAHFLDDPNAFVRLLATQPQDIRDLVVKYTIYEAEYYYYACNLTEFVDAVFSIRLNGDDNASAHAILTQLESAVEEIWGLRNPKTADPVDVILAMMLLSGLGCGVMLLHKRRNY